ncbi:glycerophosphodiester phosphodiesterase [Laribacter hongkongensis]|uniref:glycerophosphodiester phosphodiesterase n=1 Tax=Laribacter hongkongensis TaxID=168471 RepID=UPI001EFD271F|nr:glycerophosphodiester phosphodiesterase [Laribacter hongkongensis]MCG8991952.1 glycerophosphodiester phosphodiesterase [Laribacter hongkongensis]MCG8997845.1 glycerophosphodiester phosphodiesterase [Laribacter hongkongensis]MCG9003012.1 glycerophosphodiester phosphodiesterase [Laribacter hongkongensis]MCG9006328.1 glycerophosphodiester phosphodiesterase [Laribacter hongkongensis]MCG9013146.1 glycerophosphodiester phosphodiesterase [Laribacter hongkongensis]
MTTPRWPYPDLLAHRGGGRLAPENTLSALVAGALFGSRMAEFDVRLSRDNVPFLLHDDTLERTTNGQGPAAGQDWQQLARLDAGSWFDPRFAGEELPRLADAARVCREHGLAANVEIKPCPGREAETGRIVATECAHGWQRAAVPPLLSSFSPEALLAARAAAPQLNLGWLIEGPLPADWLAQARTLGVMALHLEHALVDAPLVGAAHAAGLAVLAWTVNDLATARRLRTLGVDALCTDAPDELAAG